MAKSKKGLRIGNYRITPLGLGVLAVLLLMIAAIVVLVVVQPFGGKDGILLEPLTLLLSKKAGGRPVKIRYSRGESMVSTLSLIHI